MDRLRPYLDAARRWFQSLSRRGQIIAAAVALVAVCGVCSGTLAAIGSHSPAAHPTATHPVTQATRKATAASSHSTATASGPQCVDGAVLGGSAILFLRSYQTTGADTGTVNSYTGTIQGENVAISGNYANSDAGCFHYVRVGPADSGTTWTPDQALAIGRTFLPADAKAGADKQVADFGTEHLYTSAALALAFPAGAFTDAASGATVPPGTFYLACQDQLDGTGCSLQIGE